MRIVLVLLLFQLLAPAFQPGTALSTDGMDQNPVSYHLVRASTQSPIILKEKEENEYKNPTLNFVPISLIDFTDHTLILAQLYKSRHDPIPHEEWFDREPPLFALYCAYRI